MTLKVSLGVSKAFFYFFPRNCAYTFLLELDKIYNMLFQLIRWGDFIVLSIITKETTGLQMIYNGKKSANSQQWIHWSYISTVSKTYNLNW